MSGLETAIRHALERSDRTSPETRARIYQSARNALEAGLRKQDVHDPEVVTQQRHRLETIIHAIEGEERTALRAQATAVTPPSVEADKGPDAPRRDPSPSLDDAHRLDNAPRLDADQRLDAGHRLDSGTVLRAEPHGPSTQPVDGGLDGLRPDRDTSFTAGPAVEPRRGQEDGAEAKPARGRKGKAIAADATGRKPRRRRRGRLLSLFMVAATLVAAFGTAAWWVETSGLMKSAAERDTGVANPPSTVNSEDFDGSAGLQTLGTASGFSGDWVDVFDPSKPANATARERATVSPLNDDRGPRLRISSASPEADGAALIEVPVSVLEQLSGKTSTIAVTVQSDSGKPTQFSVECDFASLGDCDRHRFTVNDEKSDMFFKVTFDRSLTPSAPGHILVNSDVMGSNSSINLYAVRVLPGQ